MEKKRYHLALGIMLSSLSMVAAVTSCFAWFFVQRPSKNIDTIVGEMNVDIEKFVAYRYVYPYYQGSNTYIDYDSPKAGVRSFVLKTSDSDKVTENSFPDTPGNTGINIWGDSVFNGTSQDDNFINSLPLVVGTDGSYVANNVTISKNAQFALLDEDSKITLTNSSDWFDQSDNGIITCKQAGLYNLIYNKASEISHTFEIKKARTDSDNAIIGMTLFDPNYAKLNTSGLNNYDPSSVAIPTEELKAAIKNQNTMLVYDVTLNIKNQAHDVNLLCKAMKWEQSKGKYINGITDPTIIDKYQASDFMNFRMKEIEVSNKDAATSLWEEIHTSEALVTKAFDNDAAEESASLDLSTTSIEGGNGTVTKRFLIGIDYNPERIPYFFYTSRLGKEYEILRDYSIVFSCVQKEYNSDTSSSSQTSNNSSASSSEVNSND